ncbi:hypothetical protein CEXT_601751 [Caerostris extrusa]|uniref:Uncharacterized protein n=1 Tax=Caerostris extrusa TaxID=172846 RepID=A0AAV4MN02_CAEEX|nr:hypothetical protein CEXT_601751 [Caerostris extrusa]
MRRGSRLQEELSEITASNFPTINFFHCIFLLDTLWKKVGAAIRKMGSRKVHRMSIGFSFDVEFTPSETLFHIWEVQKPLDVATSRHLKPLSFEFGKPKHHIPIQPAAKGFFVRESSPCVRERATPSSRGPCVRAGVFGCQARTTTVAANRPGIGTERPIWLLLFLHHVVSVPSSVFRYICNRDGISPSSALRGQEDIPPPSNRRWSPW